MNTEFSHLTPYILTVVGLVFTYIGWSIKKILENIEITIAKTVKKVEQHDTHITQMRTILDFHDKKLTELHADVVHIQKSATIK